MPPWRPSPSVRVTAETVWRIWRGDISCSRSGGRWSVLLHQGPDVMHQGFGDTVDEAARAAYEKATKKK